MPDGSPAPSGLGWTAFTLIAFSGLVGALFVFATILLGECLPHDGSAAMRACEADKRLEFYAYPSIVFVTIALAGWAWKHGRYQITAVIALLLNGFLSALILGLARGVIRLLS